MIRPVFIKEFEFGSPNVKARARKGELEKSFHIESGVSTLRAHEQTLNGRVRIPAPGVQCVGNAVIDHRLVFVAKVRRSAETPLRWDAARAGSSLVDTEPGDEPSPPLGNFVRFRKTGTYIR